MPAAPPAATDAQPLPPHIHRRREAVFLLLAGLFLGTLTMLNILGISRFIVLGSYGPPSGSAPAPGSDVSGLGLDWIWQWGVPNFDSSWTFAVAVGVLPYPLTFLCTDLISEFYGRRRANFLVWVGLILNLWVLLVLWLGGVLPGFDTPDPVTGYPPLPTWDAEAKAFSETGWTFFQVRHLTSAAVAASMVAYLAAQLVDVHVFHFWKRLTRGKHLWLRNNASTIVSQFIDTFAVITITHFYARALPVDGGEAIWPQLWLFIATGFAFKVVAALVDTPVIYGAVALLRPYLRIDPTSEHHAAQVTLFGDVAPVSDEEEEVEDDPEETLGVWRED